MKREEKKLFKELCSFRKTDFNESLLEYATPEVLGHLFFNRMQGVAYGRLKEAGVLDRVNREFRTSLKSAYETNIEKNKSFFQCVDLLSEVLHSCLGRVAMLKGAVLCSYYPEGYRTSNDIDLLLLPQDVTIVGSLLLCAGFRQGAIKNGTFVPATRKEIIASKMMRGETVPYIKQVDLPQMKFLEVDLNFSLDYKNGDSELLAAMLSRVIFLEERGIKLPTLCPEDFLLHLCAHLYKEATTLPWIEMHRDMTLYKYADIYLLLTEMVKTQDYRCFQNLFKRAKELDLEAILAYGILETVGLFDAAVRPAAYWAQNFFGESTDFLLNVISPKTKRIFRYKTPYPEERFFMYDRIQDLEEVKENE